MRKEKRGVITKYPCIADIMKKVAEAPEDETVLAACRKETQELISRFPLYPAGAFDD